MYQCIAKKESTCAVRGTKAQERQKVYRVPTVCRGAIQRCKIQGKQLFLELYYKSEGRKRLGTEKDFLMLCILDCLWDMRVKWAADSYVQVLFERVAEPCIWNMCHIHHLLFESEIDIETAEAVWDSMEKFICDNPYAFFHESFNLENYMSTYVGVLKYARKELEQMQEQFNAQNDELTVYILGKFIKERPPLVTDWDHMWDINKYIQNFLPPAIVEMAECIPLELIKFIVYPWVRVKDGTYPQWVLQYLIYVYKFMNDSSDVFRDKEAFRANCMEYVCGLIPGRLGWNEIQRNGIIGQDIKVLQDYSKNLRSAWCKIGCTDENLDLLLDNTSPIDSGEEIEEFANQHALKSEEMEIESSSAAETTYHEGTTIYDSMRGKTECAVYYFGGMEKGGMEDVTQPAFKFNTVFAPLAAYFRHIKEGVPFYRGKGSSTREIEFDHQTFKQSNRAGAFVYLGRGGSYSSLIQTLIKKTGEKDGVKIAQDILNIFEGKPSVYLQKKESSLAFKKFMAVICYAETQRHPIALMEVYLALKKFVQQSQKGEGQGSRLQDMFNAKKTNKLTPLFVPLGGAKMIRGDYEHLGPKKKRDEYKKLREQSEERILRAFTDEEQFAAKTVEIWNNIFKLTKFNKLNVVTQEKLQNFSRTRITDQGQYEERFIMLPVSGEGNNCAFASLRSILRNRYHIEVREDFAEKMRSYMGVESGVMIELIYQGEKLLEALWRYFMIDLGRPIKEIPNFVLNAVINFPDGLVDMPDIAATHYQTEARVPVMEFDLLFDGYNHFNALIPATTGVAPATAGYAAGTPRYPSMNYFPRV